jgi:hypothetical protein
MPDNSLTPGSSGSSSDIVNTENWTVQWIDLFTVMVTAVATAFFESVAAVVSEAWQLIIRPINAVGTLLDATVAGVFGGITSTLNWQPARQLAESSGPAGSVVSIALVLVGLYLLALVIGRIRG